MLQIIVSCIFGWFCYAFCMFEVRAKSIRIFESQLKAFRERALPFATKQAINSYAFKAQSIARDGLKSDFVLRNRFTASSIRVNQTRSLNIKEQESSVGTTVDYMREQEFGGHKTKQGKHGVTIPTSASAGLAESAKPRTRVPRPRLKMSSIRLSKSSRSKYSSQKQANVVAIKQALARSQKFVYLELKNRKGIFQIRGSKKNWQLRMLYDLTRTSISFRARPWLAPAVEQTQKHMQVIYFKALKFQLERFNLFKKL